MSDRDEQLEVLRAMWGEMKTLNARVNDVARRIHTTNTRLEDLREFLGARIDATNERMVARLSDLKDAVSIGRVDRRRLDLLERRVDALEQRTTTPVKPSRRPRR